jgi:Rad3-related DNA helicase
MKEAILLLKQGLGRLIRRDHVQHRRIWMMDGRIYRKEWRGMEKFAGSVKRMLRKYQAQREF